MNPLTEMIFISEIVLQSKIAIRSSDRLPKEYSGFDKLDVWVSIQSILVATGNISKILWPTNKLHRLRGEKLRAIMSIKDDSILRSRTFRNHFEHYDERIESWMSESRSVVYTDLAIDPFNSDNKYFQKFYHRAYNPVKRTLTFRNEELDLKELITEIEKLLENCGPYNQF